MLFLEEHHSYTFQVDHTSRAFYHRILLVMLHKICEGIKLLPASNAVLVLLREKEDKDNMRTINHKI